MEWELLVAVPIWRFLDFSVKVVRHTERREGCGKVFLEQKGQVCRAVPSLSPVGVVSHAAVFKIPTLISPKSGEIKDGHPATGLIVGGRLRADRSAQVLQSRKERALSG